MSATLYSSIASGDEHSGEMIKSFIEAFCTDMKDGRPVNKIALQVFAQCFEVFLTQGKTLDEAFQQKKEPGRPKNFDELYRNLAITLVVLQLNRGWLTQKDVDEIPVNYDRTVSVDFRKQTLERAYSQTAKLFSLSEESIKRIYKDGLKSTHGLAECKSEPELRQKLFSLL